MLIQKLHGMLFTLLPGTFVKGIEGGDGPLATVGWGWSIHLDPGCFGGKGEGRSPPRQNQALLLPSLALPSLLLLPPGFFKTPTLSPAPKPLST